MLDVYKRQRQRLELYMWDGLKAGRHRLALDAGRLDALSPLKKLSGGYGFVTDSRGNAVRSIGQTGTGDRICLLYTSRCV